MYAVGHLAIGYLSGKATPRLTGADVNVPLFFALSIISDVDLLIPGLRHRGPTHSIIILCLLFLPAFVFYRKKATPYFAALILHPLVGDVLTGGAQLLWPLTTSEYGIRTAMTSSTNILTEWIFFLISFTILLKTRDIQTLLQPHSSNLSLLIPIVTVLTPAFFMFPLNVPLELIIPHLIYLTIFALSILMDVPLVQKQLMRRACTT